MNRYLLDTNHLSGYLDRRLDLETRIDTALRAGDRFGICLPVLCEYRTGIRLGRRFRQNLGRLATALFVFRLWPIDVTTSVVFSEMFRELRAGGRMLSQFDLLIAATTRQYGLTLLTADQDFEPVASIKTENWLT